MSVHLKFLHGSARHRVIAVALAAATALGSVGAVTESASAATVGKVKPTIVLVHGAWADASSWSPVAARLEKAGYPVYAPANPLRGLSSDAAYLTAFLKQRVKGPIILVGHSYGGAVITEAALHDPEVKALVYVDAFAPAKGENLLGILATTPGGAPDPSTLFDAVHYPGAPKGDVDLYFKTAIFPHAFGNGLPAATDAVLAAAQRPITLHALTEAAGTPAWKTLPSWYVLGTQDKVIAPSVQLMMAKRAHSHITDVASGHLSMLVHPALVESVILKAAKAKG
jgi:pimeloyl-ACP methyl ester carboxylesterase